MTEPFSDEKRSRKNGWSILVCQKCGKEMIVYLMDGISKCKNCGHIYEWSKEAEKELTETLRGWI